MFSELSPDCELRNMAISMSTAGYTKRVWTPEEDGTLIYKINTLGSTNWNVIASFIPRRTGKQCRERWYNHLIDGGLKKGDWTAEEDKIIMSSHNSVGNHWSFISRLLKNRSSNDVKNRFYTLKKLEKKSDLNNCASLSNGSCNDSTDEFEKDTIKRTANRLEPYTKKVWSPEDDEILLNKINSDGLVNWNIIASCIPGRTGKQCRERYHNHLLDGIVKGGWSKEEDAIIRSSHLQIGNQWVQISKMLHGRSPNDVKNRCKRLTKNKELKSVDEPKNKFRSLSTETLLPYKKRGFSHTSSENNDTETESISDYGFQSKTMNTNSDDHRKTKVFKDESTDFDLQEGIIYFNNFLNSLQKIN